jgi:hypothetical protein
MATHGRGIGPFDGCPESRVSGREVLIHSSRTHSLRSNNLFLDLPQEVENCKTNLAKSSTFIKLAFNECVVLWAFERFAVA